MIQMIQSELFRIRRSRSLWGCLALAVFFVFALALTFRYNSVTVPMRKGEVPVVSLDLFTEFLFSDYSLIFPLTLFLCLIFTEHFHAGSYSLLLSKGTSRTQLFFSQLFAVWIGVLFFLLVCFGAAYFFILVQCSSVANIDYSFSEIGTFLFFQCLCFLGYTAFLNLLSCLLRHRVLVTAIAFFLLGTLYLYLTKISTALDLNDSLYRYWIVGLSHSFQINSMERMAIPSVITVIVYLLVPTSISLYLFLRLDLRGLERR